MTKTPRVCVTEAASSEQTRSRRVLVVDDNADAADSLAMLLRFSGHEVRTVYEGSAVLEAARAFQPDVILLDLGLPGELDGFDLAPLLRQEPGLENVLLVALTGYGPDVTRDAPEAGFDHHFIKPVDLASLQALLVRDNGNR